MRSRWKIRGRRALVASAVAAAGVAVLRSGPDLEGACETPSALRAPAEAEFVRHISEVAGPKSSARFTDLLERRRMLLIEGRRNACEGALRREGPSADIERARLSCYDTLVLRQSALLDTLARSRSSASFEDPAGSLPDPEQCERWAADLALVEPPPPERSEQVRQVEGALASANATLLVGDLEAAREHSAAALSGSEALEYAPLRAEALLQAGRLALEDGAYTVAAAQVGQAHWLAARAHVGRLEFESAIHMVELAGIQLEQPARGRDWLQRAELLIERHEAGRGHRIDLLSSRALLQLVAGEHEESLRTQDEVLVLLEPEDEWPIRAAGMHQHAAIALEALARDGEAAKRYARALEILASAFGEEHPRLGQVLHNLGVLEYGRGRFEVTLEHLDRAVALKEAAYGPEHPSVARSLEGRGLALIGLGRFDEALQSLERAAQVLERTLGQQHPELGVSLVNVGTAASRARDFERAAEAFDRGISILRDTLGDQDSALATALGDRSAFRLAQANPASARIDVEAALAIAQDGGDPRTYGWTLAHYAKLLAAEGKREDAAATAMKALATLTPLVGDDHPDLDPLRTLAGTG